MGGNALKNTTVKRLDRADFLRVSETVTKALLAAIPGARVSVIPAYGSKADFGDLDVLVTTEHVQAAGGGEFLQKLARETFHATDLFKNGNVLSFDYRASADQSEPGFQVDIITMPEVSFDYALSYFSFNDLGNLIGRTAHKAGLTHGHDGLWFYMRAGDYLFRNILLTRDHATALSFLGYDPKRFAQGFEGLVDIFQYVAGSEFFNSDIFLLENRNAESRVRDRKRKTYSEFLLWTAAHPDLPRFDYPQDKKEWLTRIASHFPHFHGEYTQGLKDLETQRAVKAKFNGALVGEMTGLKDKDLGILMKRFKESFVTPAKMQQYLLAESPDVIQSRVLLLQTVVENEAKAKNLAGVAS